MDFTERDVVFPAQQDSMDVNVKHPATVLQTRPVIRLLAEDQTPRVVRFKKKNNMNKENIDTVFFLSPFFFAGEFKTGRQLSIILDLEIINDSS